MKDIEVGGSFWRRKRPEIYREIYTNDLKTPFGGRGSTWKNNITTHLEEECVKVRTEFVCFRIVSSDKLQWTCQKLGFRKR
jgi:hypothetical protein